MFSFNALKNVGNENLDFYIIRDGNGGITLPTTTAN